MQPNYYERACLLAEQGRFALAKKEALRAITIAPEGDLVHNILSYCYLRLGQYEESIAAARQAISLAPEKAFHYYRLASACEEAEQYKAAMEAVEMSLALDPSYVSAYGLAASICLSCGDTGGALAFANKGLALDPEHESCWNRRVLVLLLTNCLDEAAQDVEKLMASYPDRTFSHAAKGWLFIYQGKFQQSFNCFKTALRIDPNNEWSRKGVVQALKARHRFYRWILCYELWQVRLNRLSRVAFIAMLLLLPPFRVLYLLLLAAVAFAGYAANTILRFHPYGCLVLTPREKWLNSCVSLNGFLVVAGIVVAVVTGNLYFLFLLGLPAFVSYFVCVGWFADESLKLSNFALAGLFGLAWCLLAIGLIPFLSQGVATSFLDIGMLAFGLSVVGWVVLQVCSIVAERQRLNKRRTFR